jgi:hypothetical protein
MNDPLRVTCKRPLGNRLMTLGVLSAVIVLGWVVGTASAAHDPAVVQSSCRAGSKPAVIAGNFKCLKAGVACRSRYQNVYRKYSFHCVDGRLRKGKGTTPPTGGGSSDPPYVPPYVPPAPLFQAGHYKGQTSQNETFEFDVTTDSLGVRGLRTGQINLGCTPPAHMQNYGFDFGSYTIPLVSDGSFSFDQRYDGSVSFADGTIRPSQNEAIITGHLSGAVAVGSLLVHTVFSNSGTVWDCGSGLQTWTATRTG